MRTTGQKSARRERPQQHAPAFRWSWKLVTVAGIDVHVHGTFLLLIAFLALSDLVAGHGLTAMMRGTLLILAIFATVVLHEYGHALTARRFGVRTLDITLLPIGGIARLEKMPDKPGQQLQVALAGPAVNVVIGRYRDLSPSERAIPDAVDVDQRVSGSLQSLAGLPDGWRSGSAGAPGHAYGTGAGDADRGPCRPGRGRAFRDGWVLL
jgi:hypothetical protein